MRCTMEKEQMKFVALEWVWLVSMHNFKSVGKLCWMVVYMLVATIMDMVTFK